MLPPAAREGCLGEVVLDAWGQRVRGSEYVAWRRNISDGAKNDARPRTNTYRRGAKRHLASEHLRGERKRPQPVANRKSSGECTPKYEVPPGIVDTPPQTER